MRQKLLICAILGLSIIAIMCLIPPWETNKLSLGYFPIWAGPNLETASIDSERLAVQILASIILTTIIFLIANVIRLPQISGIAPSLVQPALEKLENKRRVLFAVLIASMACAMVMVPLLLYQKIQQIEKNKLLAIESARLESRLITEQKKEEKIASLVSRELQTKFASEVKQLAKPKRWPINMRERQIKGFATTSWADGYMNVCLELRATPAIIELAEARHETMDLFFSDRATGFKVHLPVEPGSLVVQKDGAGAWSRLVLAGDNRLSVMQNEYKGLNCVRVFYSNREMN